MKSPGISVSDLLMNHTIAALLSLVLFSVVLRGIEHTDYYPLQETDSVYGQQQTPESEDSPELTDSQKRQIEEVRRELERQRTEEMRRKYEQYDEKGDYDNDDDNRKIERKEFYKTTPAVSFGYYRGRNAYEEIAISGNGQYGLMPSMDHNLKYYYDLSIFLDQTYFLNVPLALTMSYEKTEFDDIASLDYLLSWQETTSAGIEIGHRLSNIYRDSFEFYDLMTFLLKIEYLHINYRVIDKLGPQLNNSNSMSGINFRFNFGFPIVRSVGLAIYDWKHSDSAKLNSFRHTGAGMGIISDMLTGMFLAVILFPVWFPLYVTWAALCNTEIGIETEFSFVSGDFENDAISGRIWRTMPYFGFNFGYVQLFFGYPYGETKIGRAEPGYTGINIRETHGVEYIFRLNYSF